MFQNLAEWFSKQTQHINEDVIDLFQVSKPSRLMRSMALTFKTKTTRFCQFVGKNLSWPALHKKSS